MSATPQEEGPCTCPKSCYQHGASVKALNDIVAGRYSHAAFDALLAVAKAAAAENTGSGFDYRVLAQALQDLENRHPGWREWTP